MDSFLDFVVMPPNEQTKALNHFDAFRLLDIVFEDDNSTRRSKICALVEAVKFAESEDDWKVIIAFLQTDYALFGRRGGLDTLLFERCPIYLLQGLIHDPKDGLVATLDMMIRDRGAIDRPETAMICRIFAGMDHIYTTVGGEGNLQLMKKFIYYVKELRRRYEAQLPSPVWEGFKKYVPSNPPATSAPVRPHYTA